MGKNSKATKASKDGAQRAVAGGVKKAKQGKKKTKTGHDNDPETFGIVAKKRTFYYAVQAGRNPGVYTDLERCQAQVHGFSGAVYKRFVEKQKALAFVRKGKPITDEELQVRRAETLNRFAFRYLYYCTMYSI
jgi:hypothetical protein